MKKEQRTKKQHFVPETYLRNFINTANELYTLDFLKVKKSWNECPKRNSPGGICYIVDYYTILDHFPDNYLNLKEDNPLFIEDTVLTKLENGYPEIFLEIVKSTEIKRDMARDLSDFIINLKLRNPYWFERVIKKNIDS